jgi:hypothetical protein
LAFVRQPANYQQHQNRHYGDNNPLSTFLHNCSSHDKNCCPGDLLCLGRIPFLCSIYYNAQSYRFVIVLSIFSDFYTADAVFCPFRATKRLSGLKIIHIKALKMTLPGPKVVKMGHVNMLPVAGFIGLNPEIFLVGTIDSGQH